MGGLFGGGGSSAPSTPSATSQNVTTSNIAPWAQSGVSDLINAGMGQVFQTNPDGTINTNQMKGYTPFNANTPAGNEWVQGAAGSVAGFSPLQQQAQQNIANMQTPDQYSQAMNMAGTAGLGALDTTGQAAGYGALGSMYGSQAASLAPQAQQYGANAANIGATGGLNYGAMGAQAGQNAADIGTMGGMQYGQQGANAGQAAGAIGTMAGLGYGAQGSQAGQQAAGYGAQGANAGNAYGQNATNPNAVAAYMNPYLQNTLSPALQLQNQSFGQINAQNQGQATQQGAFGGGRQAVMQGLNQQNQALAQNQLVGNAYNQAYNTANQNMQTAGSQAMQGAGLGITGQQAAISGANTGLSGANTALQGQQTNISGANTGLSGVNAGIAGQNAAMQGAGMGITGTNTAVNAQQAGLQGLGQAGTLLGQGMQGAQTGLSGVGAQQAGYGQLGAQGTNLANIAGAQTQTDLNIANAQQGAGATQQQNQQNILNQAMANYNTAQTMPMTQLAQLESMYTGAPQNITSSTYSAAPNTVSQLAGLAGTAVAGAKLAGAKAGGSVKDIKKMAAGGQVAFDIGGSVANSLDGMPDAQLQQVLKTSPSQTMRQEAARVLAERQTENAIAKGVGAAPVNTQMAGGGIIAFAEGGSAEDDIAPEDIAIATKKAGSAKAKGLWDALTSANTEAQNDYVQSLMKPGSTYTPTVASSTPTPTVKPDSLGRTPVTPIAGSTNTPVRAGIGATRPAQATIQAKPDTGYLDKYMQDLQSQYGYGKPSQDELDQRAQLKQDRADITKNRGDNKWLALLAGSGAALENTSPFFGPGIGSGIKTGVQEYAKSEKDYADQLAKVRSGELDLNKLSSSNRNALLHYASSMASEEQRSKEAADSRRLTGALGQGVREDAAITARAKLILGNNPMPSAQDVENAINIATQQVSGKKMGPTPQDQNALRWFNDPANKKSPDYSKMEAHLKSIGLI